MQLFCHGSKALQDIYSCQGLCQGLQALDVFACFLANPHENLVFQISRFFMRLQHLSLNPGQLLRSETLRIFQGRLAKEMTGNMSQLRIGHMEIVTIFFIVINLQIADAAISTFFNFQLRNPSSPLSQHKPILIQGLIKTGPNDIALGDDMGRIRRNGRANQARQLWNRIQALNQTS